MKERFDFLLTPASKRHSNMHRTGQTHHPALKKSLRSNPKLINRKIKGALLQGNGGVIKLAQLR